jgi:hypothetical protein
VTRASALLALFLAAEAAFAITRPQRPDRELPVVDAFLSALGQVYLSMHLDDPQAIERALGVTLEKRPRGGTFAVRNTPRGASGVYNLRQTKEGDLRGRLFFSLARAGKCISAAKLSELTRVRFEAAPIFSHSRDFATARTQERYLASRLNGRGGRITMSAKMSDSHCVADIELLDTDAS